MKRYVYLSIFIFISFSLKSQNFNGIVVDLDNTPIEGAIVLIYNDSLYNDIYITDSLGKFSAIDVPNTLLVKISHVGYLDLSRVITIDEQLNNKHEYFYLEKSYTVLGEAVIYAKPPTIKKELGKFVISNVAQSSFAKGNNVHDFLIQMPVLNPVSGGISILNRDEPAVIYIDGRPTGLSLNSIPAKNIERIEVMAIPGAEFSASNKQGIINIILKRQIDEGFKLTMRLSDMQSYYNSPSANAYLSYSYKKINMTGSIYGSNSNPYLKVKTTHNYLADSLINDVDMKQYRKEFNLGANFNFDYHLNSKQTFGFRLFLYGSDNKNTNESKTIFSKSNNRSIDSIYLSTIESKVPQFVNSFGGNINYNLKIDDKGSLLKTDFNYRHSIHTEDIQGLYSSITGNNIGNIVQDYLQNKENKGDYFALSTDLSKILNKDNKFKTGLSINYGKINDQFIYTEKKGGDYVNDPNKTNSFLFKDFVAAAYIVYEKSWDAIEASVGLRSEYYWADGLQEMNNEKIKRDELGFFPSFSVWYTINDNHEISLDASRSIFRPTYSSLNPFKFYTSPTTYIQNNPDLKSITDYTVMLSYMFFNDYMFDIDYEYSQNVWGEFSLPDEDGLIKRIPFNYGNSHSLSFTFILQKSLFKGFWNINSNLGIEYDKDKGMYDNIEMDSDSWRFSFRMNNNVFLSKKKDWQAYLNYRLRTKGHSAATKIPFVQDLELRLQKIFKNSTLSVSANGFINRKIRLASNISADNYSYTQLRTTYPTISFQYTHTFGNKKVKTVDERYDQNMQQRTQ